MTSQVECKPVLVAGHVAECGARVVVRTLRTERHAARHFGVWPDLAFEWFDLEYLVLEEHLVFIDGLLDGGILARQGGEDLRLLALAALLHFNCVVRVVGVETLVIVIALLQGLVDVVALFDLFGRQLLVESLFFDLLLHFCGKGAPGKLNGHSALVHDLKVLVGEQRD